MVNQSENEKFDLLDAVGRDLFTTFLRQRGVFDYSVSEDRYDHLDLRYTCKGRHIGVEIKVRREAAEDFRTYVMDKLKYDALVEQMDKEKLDGIKYANFFGDKVMYFFDFKKIVAGVNNGTIAVRPMYAKVTTVVDNGKLYKYQVLIPKELGTRLVCINNKWIKA